MARWSAKRTAALVAAALGVSMVSAGIAVIVRAKPFLLGLLREAYGGPPPPQYRHVVHARPRPVHERARYRAHHAETAAAREPDLAEPRWRP